MEHTIVLEARLLVLSFSLGAILIFLYNVICLFRYLWKPRETIKNVQDIFFWCVVAVATFFLLYDCNDGTVRGFAIAGVGIGMILTGKVLKIIRKGIKIILNKLKDKLKHKKYRENKKRWKN